MTRAPSASAGLALEDPVPPRPARAVAAQAEAAPRGARFGLGALLLLACLLAYLSVLGADFIYDDLRLVQANPNVASLGAAARAFFEPLWAFENEAPNAFWRPLTVLVLALGRALTGLDPLGYHALSLLLHGLATLAAWRLASRLLGSGTLGFAVGLVFALHPVHVESVAWISAVNDPLYGLFALLALDAHFAWRGRGSPGTPVAAGLWLFVALLCKEQALAVLPIAVVVDLALGHLTSRGPGARGARAARDDEDGDDDPFADLARAYAPMLAALGAYYAGRVVAYGDLLGGFDEEIAGFFLGTWRALQLRVEIFGGFLELLAFPFDQQVFRQVRPELPEGHWPWYRALAWSAAWVAALAWAVARRHRLAAAMLLAIPTSFSLILVRYESAGAFPLSDRYLYVPVAFAGVLAAAALRGVMPARTAAGVLAALALVGGARTYSYAGTFHDEETFFRHAVEVSPDNVQVRWGMGRVLLERYEVEREREMLDEAAFHFLTSLMLGTDYGDNEPELGPDASFGARAEELRNVVHDTPPSERKPDPTVMWVPFDRLQANLGQGWCTLFLALSTPERDFDWPKVIFESTVRMWPESPEAHTGLGTVLLQMGRLEEAEESLREAVRLKRTYSEAWRNLGLCLVQQKRFDEARLAFEEALRFRPGNLGDLVEAARAAIDAGRYDVATRHLDEAARLHPRSVEPVFWRGMLYAARGDHASALRQFDAVLARHPDHPLAHLGRGRVLLLTGEPSAAAESLGRACELLPDSFDAHYHMASLLLSTPGGEESALTYLERAYALGPPNASRQVLHDQLARLVGDDWRRALALAGLDGRRSDYVHALAWTERVQELVQAEPDVPEELLVGLAYRRGRYLWGLELHERAASAYRDCLERDPRHFSALHDLALLLATDLERPAEAQPFARRALEVLPETPQVTDANQRDVMGKVLGAIAGGEEVGPVMGPVPLEGAGEDGG